MIRIQPDIEPDMNCAFRLMDYKSLVDLLCRKFKYNRYALLEEEYLEDHEDTVAFIRRGLTPL